MEFILNDESLCGQFDSIGIFLDSLKENVRCFELINNVKENKIYKRCVYEKTCIFNNCT